MINALIWGKDRPCQLDLLLRSIERYLPNFLNIEVLYKATTPEFYKGYQKLFEKHPTVQFLAETEEVKLDEFTIQTIKNSKYIFLSTDDTVIFRPLKVSIDRLEQIVRTNSIFSLRYGFNTIVLNCHTGELQRELTKYSDYNDYISWDFTQFSPVENYGYPFGLDGHVFHSGMLYQLIKNAKFTKTNGLESHLVLNCRHLIPPYLSSFKESVAVNVPCNVQSGITRAGEKYAFGIEELNQKFLDGYTISLESFNKENIVGCHQEVNFEFIKE